MKTKIFAGSSSKSFAILILAASASTAHGDAVGDSVDAGEGAGGDPAVNSALEAPNQRRNLRFHSPDAVSSSSSNSVDVDSYPNNIGTDKKTKKTKKQQLQTPRHLQTTTLSAPGCGGSSGTTHSVYLGCYDDKSNDRAMPYELYEGYSNTKRLGHAALDCERECSNRGYRYFAREFRGQCFCGNSEAEYSKHGLDSGCDCCGSNVGPGRMCVWENANHPDSQAEVKSAPVVLPQNKPVSTVVALPPRTSFSLESSHASGFFSSSASNIANISSQSATTKPVGGFRIRLYWENGFNWQGSRKERFWCMECRGSCSNGDEIQIESCDFSNRQKFIAIGKTIRPSANPDLCMTTSGYSGKSDPITLRSCNGGSNQNYLELKSYGKFELQPEGNTDRCMSQHHHPKAKEVLYAETCQKTRRFDTTYWTTY